MKNMIVFKIFGVLSCMLLFVIVLALAPEEFQSNNWVRSFFLLAITIEFGLLLKLINSTEFYLMMKRRNEYMNDENNQITVHGIVKFDVIVFALGILFFFIKKYSISFLYEIGYDHLAISLNNVFFAIMLMYFTIVFIAVIYTIIVFKENK